MSALTLPIALLSLSLSFAQEPPCPVGKGPSRKDYLGPYYKVGTPNRNAKANETENQPLCPMNPPNAKHSPVPLKIRGRVMSTANGCKEPIPFAIVDLWQADQDGIYSMFRDQSQFGVIEEGQRNFECRGFVTADAEGNYEFTTVFPKKYWTRPQHIHARVSAACSHNILTTQLYFREDPTIRDWERWGWDKSREGNILDLTFHNGTKYGRWDVYLRPHTGTERSRCLARRSKPTRRLG